MDEASRSADGSAAGGASAAPGPPGSCLAGRRGTQRNRGAGRRRWASRQSLHDAGACTRGRPAAGVIRASLRTSPCLTIFAGSGGAWNAPPDPKDPSKKADDGLKRNQFGATVGGPVLRDRTFFFFSFQGTRIRRRPNEINRNTFTATERQGDFSQSGVDRAINDPVSEMPFPNKVIPSIRLFPGSVAFANDFLPVPTGGTRRTTVTQVANFDENQTLFKIDQQAGSKVRVSGRASWNRAAQPGNLNQSNFYEDTTQREWNNTSVVGNVQWTLSPIALNQTTFSVGRMEGPSKQIRPAMSWNDLGVNITLDEFT